MEPQKTQVRIVAGSLRGRKINCVVSPVLRPTPQMVREALFSILGNAVPGRPFFDIFAGTGVNGLEAISRGASEAIFLERDPRLANDIQACLNRFDVADKGRVLRGDVYRWAERWMAPLQPVNLFFSPPFADLDPAHVDAFLKCVIQLRDKMPNESVMSIQVEDNFPADRLPDLEEWDQRKYGRNQLFFWVKDVAPTPPAEELSA